MKLYIAEKPSLGRAIADVLPKPHRKENGFIRLGNGDCVTWCIGHLLEQAEPQVYNAQFKQWRLEHLPIVPERWQLLPKPKTKSQLSIIKKLVKQADQLIHVGDPDREGQLLVDELINYLQVDAKKRNATQRCLINDLNPTAVSRALSQLRQNTEFKTLSISALSRTRADWLYGINMTRAYTLQGQKVGYDGVLSVGRVQTPILGLVARRDQEIAAFKSMPFFEVLVTLQTPSKQTFDAKWHPSEACEPYQDEEGRVLNKKLADNVVQRVADKPAVVHKVTHKKKTQPPPLPYNLSTLQIDAAKRYGMSAKQVLDSCQNLYERHKLITYPRSDCRYLPVEHFKEANEVLAAIFHNSAALNKAVTQAQPTLKTAAWNDKKVEAHHAIIPTSKHTNLNKLNQSEQQLYELIARQYICQFYPKHEYSDSRIEVIIEGGLFVATERQTMQLGWKVLIRPSESRKSNESTKSGDDKPLPILKKDDNLHCIAAKVLEKQTQPPAHFTDATLLAAITGIARFVKNTEIRKILRETDGLGTEATRAGILELLFTRGFLSRQGKQIRATPAGQALIQSLPELASTPDMTAHWEFVLDAIKSGKTSYQNFMQPLIGALRDLIAQSKAVLPTALKGMQSTKPNKFKAKKRSRHSAKLSQ